MERLNKIFVGVVLLCVMASCETKPSADYMIIDGFAEGTTYHIVYNDPQKRNLQPAIDSLIAQFDASLSIYNPKSKITRINQGDTTVEADLWLAECFYLSMAISRATGGIFDITVGPLISVYGFGAEERVEVTDAMRDSIMQFVGYEKIRFTGDRFIKSDPRVSMDFNAIAKGYSVDLVSSYIESLGIADYLVEIGGEIFCRGLNSRSEEWKVGVDRPEDGNFVPGASMQTMLCVSGVGLATSGNYRKFAIDADGNKIVHTIDPRTGLGKASNILSATIIAPSCAVADGYATACMAAGLDESKRILSANPDLEAYLVYNENGQMKVYMTDKMSKRVTNIDRK